jgi:hypothetical protein
MCHPDQIGDTPVRNAREAVAALGNFKARDKVPITLRRGTGTSVVTVETDPAGYQPPGSNNKK